MGSERPSDTMDGDVVRLREIGPDLVRHEMNVIPIVSREMPRQSMIGAIHTA
jgi:hypothetical protein